MGSNNGQFNPPCQLTADAIGRVFLADCYNVRHRSQPSPLTSSFATCLYIPFDIRVTHDCLYVLCRDNYYPVFHSQITCGKKLS